MTKIVNKNDKNCPDKSRKLCHTNTVSKIHYILMNLVDESMYSCGDINLAIRVYAKFFMRNKSRASLSLTILDDGMNILFQQ